MSGIRIKETMEQIHMPEEMREQIIRNIQDAVEKGHAMEKGHAVEKGHVMEKCHAMEKGYTTEKWDTMEKGYSMQKEMGHGKNRLWRGKKRVAVAAAIVLAAGIVSIPVQAIVRSFVMARMEDIPQARVKDIARMIEEQNVEADSFSRDFSDSEKERMKGLRWSYRDGIFPEETLRLVEQGEEMPEGTLYYVIGPGYFNLPEREMTDQELLQIIDFNEVRNYALSQTPAGQEARGEYLAEQEQLRELVAAQDGISQEEAVEIAAAQMESQLGAPAEGTKYSYVYLKDISKEDPTQKTAVVYVVVLRSAGGGSPYVCKIDATDGSILAAGTNLPYSRFILDE
ncbi:MAG TPA: hypothetical protein DCZ91_18385 [Lachnospiraceae bacterium]|nr:hypothetical protein [Lachnospiraceae bacterium]